MADFTNLAKTKAALGISNTGLDAAITAMIPQVTRLIENILGRTYFTTGSDTTEYPWIRNDGSTRLFLNLWPVVGTITSIHESQDNARVYDATTLLTVDTEYLLEPTNGIVYRVGGYWPVGPRTVKVVYEGGVAADAHHAELERAAQEILAAKVAKGTNRMYHLTQSEVSEGIVTGITKEDVPQSAREMIMSHRVPRVS